MGLGLDLYDGMATVFISLPLKIRPEDLHTMQF